MRDVLGEGRDREGDCDTRGKLIGVTETETCETRHEATTTERIKCIETREIEGELDGVKEDEHTHTQR